MEGLGTLTMHIECAVGVCQKNSGWPMSSETLSAKE